MHAPSSARASDMSIKTGHQMRRRFQRFPFTLIDKRKSLDDSAPPSKDATPILSNAALTTEPAAAPKAAKPPKIPKIPPETHNIGCDTSEFPTLEMINRQNEVWGPTDLPGKGDDYRSIGSTGYFPTRYLVKRPEGASPKSVRPNSHNRHRSMDWSSPIPDATVMMNSTVRASTSYSNRRNRRGKSGTIRAKVHNLIVPRAHLETPSNNMLRPPTSINRIKQRIPAWKQMTTPLH